MYIKIAINDNNYVTSYAKIGNVENSVKIEIDDDTFADFKENFKCYKYENNSLIVDSEKKDNEILEAGKDKAREQRSLDFEALDLYDKAVLRGDIEETNEMKAARDLFRTMWLEVPDKYTDTSIDIANLYPIMPVPIEYFR